LSASIGGAPFTVNIGPKGVYGTASIPGTGIQFRQRLSADSPGTPMQSGSFNDFGEGSFDGGTSVSNPPLINPSPELNANVPALREIRSASTERLTSDGLKELKNLIQAAHQERTEITSQLCTAKDEQSRVTARFKSWERGFFLKKVFRSAFEVRKIQAQLTDARVSELQEQLRLTTISTEIDLANEQAEPFFRLRDDFISLSECAAIWDVKAEARTDKSRERTIAGKSISREKIQFELGSCDVIQWQETVPHLKNANGGDLFLYPGLILYRASRTAFSIIDFHDVELATSVCSFHEEDGVPSDSTVIGKTWAKTNKDGSRDKRFAHNYEIPIALYGELTLTSKTGLYEKFLFSNQERTQRFAKSWNSFVASFDHQISLGFSEQIPDIPVEAAAAPNISPENDIHLECNYCGQPIDVNPQAVGQEFRCPTCGKPLLVPNLAH
jgi:hypothetical protein